MPMAVDYTTVADTAISDRLAKDMVLISSLRFCCHFVSHENLETYVVFLVFLVSTFVH